MLDPQKTIALIFGVSECPKAPTFQPLPQCANSARDFDSYVRSKLSLPASNILNLFDSSEPAARQVEQISDWLELAMSRESSDLLLYYTGHAGFARADGSYFLAIRDTSAKNDGGTSIRYTDLAHCIKQNAPRVRRYLILDCCFAAAAVPRHQADLNQVVIRKVENELPPSGTALLCSSSSKLASVAPDGKRHTMFSGALLRCLDEGIAGGAQALSLEDIGGRAREIIQEEFDSTAVRPELHVPEQQKGNPARIPLFPNPMWDPSAEPVRAPSAPKGFRIERLLVPTIAAASGVASALTISIAQYPWGGPDFKNVDYFAPLFPGMCFVVALLIILGSQNKATTFGLSAIAWIAWLISWNVIYIPMFAIEGSPDFKVLVMGGPAAFVGAFILNLGVYRLLNQRSPSFPVLKTYAFRSFCLAALSALAFASALTAHEGLFKFWSSLAIFLPWQYFAIVGLSRDFLTRSNSIVSHPVRWPTRKPIAAFGVALLVIGVAPSFGSKSVLRIKRMFSNDPVLFEIRSSSVSGEDEKAKTKSIRLEFLVAKLAPEAVSCEVEVTDELAAGTDNKFYFKSTFFNGSAEFDNIREASMSTLSARLICGDYNTEWLLLAPGPIASK